MIHVLACKCHNAEPIARRTMREAEYDDWLTQPIIRGKEECLRFLERYPEDRVIGSLKLFLKKASSWTVILGEDNGKFDWVDVGHGNVKDKLDGEIIVRNYGGVTKN